VVTVVVAVLVAAALSFWAWLIKLNPLFIVLIFIGVATFIVILINQLDSFFHRHKKGLSKFTDKEIESSIREWLDIPGFVIQRLDIIDDPEALFSYIVVDGSGRRIGIRRSKKDSHCIGMWADIPIPAESKEMHVKLTQDELKKLAGTLTLEMLRLGCSYELSNFSKKGFLFRIYSVIPIDDSLTASIFKSEGAQLARAYTLIIGIMGLTLHGLGINVPMHPKATSKS